MREISIGTFDNFNRWSPDVKGSLAGGIELIYDTLLTLVARRSVERIRAAGRKRQLSGRLLLRHLPAARRSEMARRHAGDARGRDFLLRGVQEKQPVLFRLLPARRQSREDRRARDHLHLRRPRQPRTAADRRRAHRAAQSTGGKAPTRTARSATSAPPRSSRRSAAALTASRNSRPAAPSSTNGSRTIGARTSTSISAATISTSCASNISATPPSRSKRSRPTRSTGATKTAPRTGPRLTISRRSPTSASMREEFPINNSGMMQAFAFNIRRAKFQDPRVRRAFNYAFDFEEMNKQIFFGQYKRIASYFEGTELAATGLPAGRELEILETVRDKVPPEVFTTPYTNPVSGNPENVRNNLREAMRLSQGRRLRDPQPAARQHQDRRALHGRVPRRRSELRARLSVLQALARPARHRRDGAHGRRRAIREPAAQLGFRHHHACRGANRCRPATSSAAIGARRPPTSPARKISSASRIRRSTP